MFIKTVFNNNSVIAINEKNEELVLFGCGIGFKASKGNLVDDSKIEKTFTLTAENNEATKRLSNLLVNIPDEITSVTFKVIDFIEENSKKELSDFLYVTLMDHLNMAVKLCKDNITNPNLMMYEIQKYYPEEFELAEKSRKFINQNLNIELSEYEVGHIALHIINAQINHTSTYDLSALDLTKKIKDIVNIIRLKFKLKFDNDSFVYDRLIYHLKYLILSISSDENDENDIEFDMDMINSLFNKYSDVLNCVNKIEYYLQTKLNKNQKFFLMIHIIRVLK
jgi:beta-glucoside operon transcriptional antiterminator